MADYGLLAGIGEALTSGTQAYAQSRKMKEDREQRKLQQKILTDREAREKEGFKYKKLGEEISAESKGFRIEKDPESGELRKVYDPEAYQRALRMKQAGSGFMTPLQKVQFEKTMQELKLKKRQTGEFKQNQYQAAGFAKRAEAAQRDMDKLKDFDPTSLSQYAQSSMLYPSLLQTPGFRQYQQIKDNFITAVLRKESGAAIGKDEYVKEDRKYFPQPGDDPQTLAQKERERLTAIASLKAEAGGAYEQIPTITKREVPKQKSEGLLSGPKKAYADARPKEIKKFGRTYRLNEEKGGYELVD